LTKGIFRGIGGKKESDGAGGNANVFARLFYLPWIKRLPLIRVVLPAETWRLDFLKKKV
jgi:hypothetical protein